MVAVDGDVETEVLGEVMVATETEHVRVVADKVEILVNAGQRAAGVVDIAVDPRGEGGKTRDEVDGVLEGVGPVLGLLDTLLVCRGERAVVVERGDTHGELRHRVQRLGEPSAQRKYKV